VPYATQSEFIDAFGEQLTIELTNLEDPTATAVDSTVFDRVAADGDSLIDSYLSGRYALPLATVPGVLRSLALDIYRYKLGHNAQEEDVRQRYEDALALLKMIAMGTVNLGLPATDEAPGPGPVAYSAPRPIFSRDTLGDFGAWP
jgi:phage gp36-like protein